MDLLIDFPLILYYMYCFFFLLDYIQLTFFVGNEAIMALLKTTQKDSKIHGLT